MTASLNLHFCWKCGAPDSERMLYYLPNKGFYEFACAPCIRADAEAMTRAEFRLNLGGYFRPWADRPSVHQS